MVIDPEGVCPDCHDPISAHDELGCHWGGRAEPCSCRRVYPSPQRVPAPPIGWGCFPATESGFQTCGAANTIARVWARATGRRWRVTYHPETRWTATETTAALNGTNRR